jgi:hypothetical protein
MARLPKDKTLIRGFLFLLFTLISTSVFAKVDSDKAVDRQTLMSKVSTLQIPFIKESWAD